MEEHFRSILGEFSGKSAATAVLALSFLLFSNAVVGVTEQEIDATIEALRSKGYKLFGNAIDTSDLRYELLAGDSFTFFAPTDSSLFSLDMLSEASDYVQTLRCHMVPRRLTISDLCNLTAGPYLDTLLPNHGLLISNRHNFSDGVPISVPDLYLGSSIATHGLNGILASRFPAGANFSHDQGFGSPGISPGDCFCTVSYTMAPNLITPVSSSASQNEPVLVINKNSSFRKHGKHHKHRSRRERHEKSAHGHQQVKDDGIQIGKS